MTFRPPQMEQKHSTTRSAGGFFVVDLRAILTKLFLEITKQSPNLCCILIQQWKFQTITAT